jgi:ABC-type multidrug transport system fused ATPase/permease subunit
MGQKYALFIQGIVGITFSLIFCFFWGWKLTLILFAAFPVLAFIGSIVFGFVKKGTVGAVRAYSTSSGYAEQAFSAIKVVQTYCNENLEFINYTRNLKKSLDASLLDSHGMGVAMGAMMFAVILLYAYALFFGGLFIWNGYEDYLETGNLDQEYTGGSVVSIMFTMIIGAFLIGSSADQAKSVGDSQIAAKLAFDVIDHVAGVDPNDKNAVPI